MESWIVDLKILEPDKS